MSDENRRISATANVDGGAGSVSSYSLSASLNTFAFGQVDFHGNKGGKESSDILTSELISAMSSEQKRMFGARSKTEVSIKASDGKGGNIAFDGFSVRPALSLQKGSGGALVSRSLSAVHQASVIDAIALSCYRISGVAKTQADFAISAPDLATRISKVIEFLRKRWSSEASTTGDELAIAKQVDAQNKPLLDYLAKILGASKDSTKLDGLDEILSARPAVNDRINGAIATTLLTQESGFFTTLRQLCHDFQLVYIPSFDPSNLGKLVTSDSLMKGTKSKAVNLTGISIELGERSVLPVNQIVVMAPTGSAWQPKVAAITGISSTQPNLMNWSVVSFPDKPKGNGKTGIIGLPSWLPSAFSAMTSEFAIQPNAGGGRERGGFAEQRVTRLAESVDSFKTGALKKLITQYAKNVYVDTAMADHRANITCELDFEWQLGQRYEVTSGGTPLFTGTLAGIRHSGGISGESGNASTALNFSYVAMNGFTLPGI